MQKKISLKSRSLAILLALLMVLSVMPFVGSLAQENTVTAFNTGTVLTVIDSRSGASVAFSMADIENQGLMRGPFTFSNNNTWPSYETNRDITGVIVTELLTAAGIGNIAGNQSINFVATDGFRSTMTWNQLLVIL